MSHHGPNPFDKDPSDPDRLKRDEDDDGIKRQRRFRDLITDTAAFRGEIGAFPQGKLTDDDEGAIQFGIAHKDGKVVLDFGKPVHWLGMTPQDAADLASSLLKFARYAAVKDGKPVSIKL